MQHSSRVCANIVVATFVSAALAAQEPPPKPDSMRWRYDTLEAVVIKAVRASAASPASQYTVTRDAISKTFVGQDAPLYLLGAPSMTAYSDAGGYSGYSYLRLRGIDQTRLNITLDGVPLNDPEDQVLYFSNVPDFLASMQSVQIQRGVGASTFGTASYGGSMNFQSVPLATTARGGEVNLTGGSFNTMRGSAQYASGMVDESWAAYARITKQHSDGYRYHSGNDSQSAFVGAGWFGARDALKFTGFAGVSGTREAYLGAAEGDLAVDRRTNPLTDAEGDRFHQEMASVQYSRSLAEGATVTVTGYRNSAAGAFDVNVGATPGGGPLIDNFYLAHVWHGVISALSLQRGPASLDLGVHLSDYHREHAMAVRPNLTQREYTNVGFKQEQSGFAKFAYEAGGFRLSADMQVRRAAFQYQPSANAGIAPTSLSWTFVNPKAGISWHAAGAGRPFTLFASYGRTQREPARGDLFAGADDLNSQNAASILPLTRVRPETVRDFEAGAAWEGNTIAIRANVFSMDFRDEIAPIGELSLTGNPLRQNVPASYRRGVEFDATWRASARVTASANLTLMQARILSYRDAGTGVTYTNVQPLLTPPTISNQQVEVQITRSLSLIASGRYVARSFLANDGDARFIVPPAWTVDGALSWRLSRVELRMQVFNALDANAYASGYRDATTRYFYPVAARSVLFTSVLALP
ncbi:MAG TPA: TonB-dependent receptor [Gemmatimonadaceae bacterium]|nr:TonB-dependent receptor [Gemmatimonadaceae bacterium]